MYYYHTTIPFYIDLLLTFHFWTYINSKTNTYIGETMTTKLTLSVDPAVVAKARRISKIRRISVSAMFSNYIASLEDETPNLQEMPPITRRVLEMGAKIPQLPADWDYRNELSDIIAEKYGVK